MLTPYIPVPYSHPLWWTFNSLWSILRRILALNYSSMVISGWLSSFLWDNVSRGREEVDSSEPGDSLYEYSVNKSPKGIPWHKYSIPYFLLIILFVFLFLFWLPVSSFFLSLRHSCFQLLSIVLVTLRNIIVKVRENAKMRNRYNEVPHTTQDTIWESDKKLEKLSHTRKPRGQPFPNRWPQGNNKQASQNSKTNAINKKDLQKKHRLGTVSNKNSGRL